VWDVFWSIIYLLPERGQTIQVVYNADMGYPLNPPVYPCRTRHSHFLLQRGICIFIRFAVCRVSPVVSSAAFLGIGCPKSSFFDLESEQEYKSELESKVEVEGSTGVLDLLDFSHFYITVFRRECRMCCNMD